MSGSEVSDSGSAIAGGDAQSPGLLNTVTNMTNVSNITNMTNMTNVTNMTQRIKLNVKVLGVQLGPGGTPESPSGHSGSQGGSGEKQSYREQFMAPEMSIVGKFMSKVGPNLSNVP